MSLSPEDEELLRRLRSLQRALRQQTRDRYNRLNPFYENLADWKERGAFWAGEPEVTIYESATLIGDVQIGEHSWIGPFCLLDGSGGLRIGKYCSISSGSQLLTHDTVRWALSGGRLGYERAPVQIGDCCFIGTHTVVTKGVTIGDHCLVAATSVVTRDFPPLSIVAGVPARRIGTVILDVDGGVTLDYGSNFDVSPGAER